MSDIITSLLIKENIILEEDLEIYKYSMFVILFNMSSILSIIILSAVFNSLQFALLFLCFFIPIRITIGGFHCKNEKSCFISFLITYIFILFFSRIFCIDIYCLYIGLISIILIITLFINSKKNSIFKILLILFSIIMCFFVFTNTTLYKPFMYANVLNLILYLIPKCFK